jgi:hypothetical protein
MKQMETNNKKLIVLLDDEDFERCKCGSLSAIIYKGKLKCIKINLNDGKSGNMQLSRFILKYTGPLEIDHRDRNKLNYQKVNLRLATTSQNCINKNKNPKLAQNKNGATSKYKGVSWNTNSKMWVAQIQVKGAKKHLGYFENDLDAAKAYDKAVLKYFGDFAVLNFPVSVGETWEGLKEVKL